MALSDQLDEQFNIQNQQTEDPTECINSDSDDD